MLKLSTSGEMRVKRIAALALAVMMTAGMAGCSKSSGFENDKKKLIAALEKCCDAEEMTEKSKKKVIKNNMDKIDDCFDGSVYVTLTSEDIESMDIEEDFEEEIQPDKVENMFMFRKKEEKTYIDVKIYELCDEKYAQKNYNSLEDSMEYVNENLGYKALELKKKDNNMMCWMNFFGTMVYGYYEINGKTITFVSFFGNTKDDLYDEFCDFLCEMEYTDMVDFMDEVD